MTPFEEKIMEAVAEIVDVKRSTKRFPASASITEIMNSLKVEVKEALNGLYRQGKITWYENVNGIKMFSIKEE